MPTSAADRRAGFTLLEVTLALALFAILAGMAGGMLAGGGGAAASVAAVADLDAAARGTVAAIVADLRDAQVVAPADPGPAGVVVETLRWHAAAGIAADGTPQWDPPLAHAPRALDRAAVADRLAAGMRIADAFAGEAPAGTAAGDLPGFFIHRAGDVITVGLTVETALAGGAVLRRSAASSVFLRSSLSR